MRRTDKEISDKASIEKILNNAEILRIAMVDGDEPYLVAMNYAYIDGCIYLHSAKEGRKIDILKRNNKVAFQTETNVELYLGAEAHNCTTKYLSVFGVGRAIFVEDKDEKVRALDAIMEKHTGKRGYEYPEGILLKTLVIKVEIESLTGKKSGY